MEIITCTHCKEPKSKDKFRIGPKGTTTSKVCKVCVKRKYKSGLVERNPAQYLWQIARERAQKKGIPFSIDVEDIIIPTHCPYLGIKLEINSGTPRYNSLSLDKIVPSLGYVKGNIQVVSNKANSWKSDLSIEELINLARSILKIHEPLLE